MVKWAHLGGVTMHQPPSTLPKRLVMHLISTGRKVSLSPSLPPSPSPSPILFLCFFFARASACMFMFACAPSIVLLFLEGCGARLSVRACYWGVIGLGRCVFGAVLAWWRRQHIHNLVVRCHSFSPHTHIALTQDGREVRQTLRCSDGRTPRAPVRARPGRNQALPALAAPMHRRRIQCQNRPSDRNRVSDQNRPSERARPAAASARPRVPVLTR